MRQVIEDHLGISKGYPWNCSSDDGLEEMLNQTDSLQYDRIVDLQNNWRSRRLSRKLSGKIHRVNKEEFDRVW